MEKHVTWIAASNLMLRSDMVPEVMVEPAAMLSASVLAHRLNF